MKTIKAFLLSIILLLRWRIGHGFRVPVLRTTRCNSNNSVQSKPATGKILFLTNGDENSSDSGDGKLSRFKNLLGRLSGNSKQTLVKETSSEEDTSRQTAATSLLVVEKDKNAKEMISKPDTLQPPLKPMEQAKRLRSAAEKARLEAERMDVALTLEKISRLEKELTKPKADVETLQRQLTALQRKLTEAVSLSTTKTNAPSIISSSAATSPEIKTDSQDMGQDTHRDFSSTELSKIVESLDEDLLRQEIERLENTPKFLLKSLALAAGEPADDNGIFNATKVALKLDQIKRYDFYNNPKPAPVFTAAQVEAKEQELKKEAFWATLSPLKEKAGDNSTKFALLLLEFEYYTTDTVTDENGSDIFIEKLMKNNELLQQLNKSRVDTGIETLYPACTRRSEIPTDASMERFMKQVLPKTEFVPSGTYQKVESGYIIRGTVKRENANVVESIDRALGPLAEKMTVLYTPDFTIFIDEDSLDDPFFDPDSLGPILYVVGPEVTRESKPIQLGITSALGLATSWYLSIYPFLLNTDIAKRVDEDLALVDAGLQPDLLWLTDLSVPMFASFMSILLAHEMGHIFAAGIHKVSGALFLTTALKQLANSISLFHSSNLLFQLLSLLSLLELLAL